MRPKAILSLTVVCLTVGLALAVSEGQSAAPSPASLRAVTLSGSSSGGEVLLRIEGDYSYQAIRASEDTLLVDLKGVRSAGTVRKSGGWPGGILSGYRVVEYTGASGQPVARVLLEFRRPGPAAFREEALGLRILIGEPHSRVSGQAVSAASPEPSEGTRDRSSARALPKATPGAPAQVSGITISPGNAGEVVVDIATDRAAEYNVFRLADPPRLVVDLENAHRAAEPSYPFDSPILKGVRVGQFRGKNPAVVRVVADLVGDPKFDVHAYSGGVRVRLKSTTAPSGVAQEAQADAGLPAQAAQEPQLKPVQVAVSAPSSVVAASPVEEAAAAPQHQAAPTASAGESASVSPSVATAVSIDVQNTLPAAAGAADVAAAPKPSAPEEAPEAIQAARAAMTLARGTTVLMAAPQDQAAAAAPEEPAYTGEPISLNLKDVDLKDFFRLIHEISGLNIIVDPNVTGSVTLVLDAVPWDQALDIVLKNNRLGKTLEGNVLRIARLDTLMAEQEAATKLAAAREEALPLVTVFRPVNYAKAQTIATMLKSWVGGGALSRRGNILVDERTNTLIVSDIQTQIPVIESIITRLDTKAKQVQIEARIVRASADFSRNLAAALNAGYVNRSGSTVVGGATGPSSSSGTEVPPGAIELTPARGVGFGTVAVTNVGARYFINAALAAAETRAQAKTISRPTIVTQNNVPGTVQQGTQIPIQTTINNTISIQYVSAALTLRVTPQVTEDGNIFLDIQVTNAAPGAVYTGAGPSINTQEATTQVLVPDGGTVVFGGVTVTTRSKSVTQVPLLGSIPLLGNLFKSSLVQDLDQELLFFVSPKVLPG